MQILLEHPGELVAREELQRQIWPADTFVDFEKGLNNAIKRLRDALGDSAEQPQFIETHSRRGYRFIGLITAATGAGRTEEGASTDEVGLPARSRPLYRRLAIGAVLFLAFVATLFGLDVGGVRQRWVIRASSPVIHSLAVLPLAGVEGGSFCQHQDELGVKDVAGRQRTRLSDAAEFRTLIAGEGHFAVCRHANLEA